MSSDRTPADVIASAFSVGRGVTNSPEALAARVLDALAVAGFRVVPKPDDAPGSLPDRLRQIADDLMYGRTASTHSEACWQWHESCALHRAAGLLSGDGEEP